jgi:tetratricopeptide (TPR) repeat protein
VGCILRSRFQILVLLLGLFATGCAFTPIRQASWVVVNSPRFEVLSTLPAEETRALTSELERFHALVYAVTSAPATESPVPTRIYVFSRKSDYREFAPQDTAGVFYEGVRMNAIVLTNYSRKLGPSEVILHEYTHFVLNNGSTSQYPVWYNEGFAELLSSVRTHEDLIVLGAVPEARRESIQNGRWLQIDEIVSATGYDSVEEDERHMLYAESWALVHYLTLDRPESGSFGRDLAKYMRLTESGITPNTAFEEAFGESPKDLSHDIIRVLQSKDEFRVIGIPIKNIQYDRTEPTVRIPTEVEIAIKLGELLLRRGEGAAAELEFAAAVALDPTASRAQAGLGNALNFQDKWEAAEPHFIRAVELGPDDPMNHLDLAEFLHDQALRAKSSKERRKLLVDARRGYAHCRGIDDSIPEAWLMEGKTYLAPGENPREGLAMLNHALVILPSSTAVLLALAEARVALGQERQASDLIGKAYANRLDGNLHQSKRAVIDGIKSRRAEQAATTGPGSDTDDPGRD